MASLQDNIVKTSRKHLISRSWIFLITVHVLLCTAQTTLAKKDNLKEVTDANWEDILTGEWMIEFFAPWCPACRQLQPVWEDFADWGDDLGVNIAKVDVTEQPGLSGRFIITSLPTIYHCKDGVFRRYQGPRTKDDFLSFIDEKKWQGIEPVSSWFGPSSIMMNTMSALFKLSMFIRHCHNYLTEQLGIPVWGSYVIFALATLFSGLILGLILVFIADFVFPSRRFPSDYYDRKLISDQVRLRQQMEDEQMADGEEDDEEEEEDDEDDDDRGSRDDLWRKGRGSPEGRSDVFGDEALRRRVLATREEEEEEDT